MKRNYGSLLILNCCCSILQRKRRYEQTMSRAIASYVNLIQNENPHDSQNERSGLGWEIFDTERIKRGII